MHRLQALIILGIVTAVSPYLGLPYSVLMFCLPVVGLISSIIALTLLKKHQSARERLAYEEARDQESETDRSI